MAKSNSTTVHGANHEPSKVVRLGVIGCGEISQVAHIPMLNLMSDYYCIAYLCDISKQSLEHCASKVAGTRPKVTTKADELCSSSDVDAVIVCNATAFHHTHAILALQHDKHFFVEKPLALSYRDLDALQAAEDKSKGILFVGYMRRYAPAFLQAIAEIGDKSRIQYTRVRDIIGPNAHFVNQSGTFPKKLIYFEEADSETLKAQDDDINQQALVKEFGVPFNDQSKLMLLCLGGLGSHDLSAMREAIGMPQAIIGADLRLPVWSAMLRYDDFTVVYESGINSVPVFDAHIEIYTDTKIARVNYDTPYVKGLPTILTIREKVKDADTYQERTVRPTYEDSYTIEFKEWYQCITEGKTPKTTIADARQDFHHRSSVVSRPCLIILTCDCVRERSHCLYSFSYELLGFCFHFRESTHSQTMEDLPAELLQQIAWFSLSPELYLVSKKISSKLIPLQKFETDVAFLLFCDRVGPIAGWDGVDPFPWQSPQAATCDYKLSLEKRRELQQLILTQSWFTMTKFRQITTRLYQEWIDRQWLSADMSEESSKALQDYLQSGLFEGPRTFFDNHGNMLWSLGYGSMAIYERDSLEAPVRTVFEVLCYPLKLFIEPRSPSKLRCFYLLWSFMPRHQVDHPAPPIAHPQSTLRKALSSVVVDGDEDWFQALFPLAVSSGVDIPVHQLVHEVLVAVLSGRKWKLMEQICQGIRLPGDYLESCLVPAMTQAISDGDTGARDFQQWIEREGWANIQRETAYPEW